MTAQQALSVLAALLPLAACRADPDSARGVAQRFVDQHYVEMNLERAKTFCTGLALHKLAEEQQLIAGQIVDAGTRKPTVRYRVLSQKEGPDDATYIFEGTILVEGADTFSRRWFVTVRRAEGAWRVSNFSEE